MMNSNLKNHTHRCSCMKTMNRLTWSPLEQPQLQWALEVSVVYGKSFNWCGKPLFKLCGFASKKRRVQIAAIAQRCKQPLYSDQSRSLPRKKTAAENHDRVVGFHRPWTGKKGGDRCLNDWVFKGEDYIRHLHSQGIFSPSYIDFPENKRIARNETLATFFEGPKLVCSVAIIWHIDEWIQSGWRIREADMWSLLSFLATRNLGKTKCCKELMIQILYTLED